MTDKTAHAKPADSTDKRGIVPIFPVIAVVIVLAIYFGSQIFAGLLLALVPGLSSLDTDSTTLQFWYVVLFELITLGLLYWFLKSQKVRVRALGLRRPKWSDLGATILAYPPYFVLNAIVALSATALFQLDADQKQQTGFDGVATSNSMTQLVMVFISLVVLPPIVEEIVMRGFLFGSLKNGLKVVWAALLTSVIFAVAHLQFGSGAPLLWLAACDTFVLSLVLCYLRQKTGALWAGIGLHAVKNALAFSVLFVFPRYHLFPELTGTVLSWVHWTM